MRKRLSFCCLLLITSTLNAQPMEHVIWDKAPIRITLPFNEERLIRFPVAVSVLDSELDDESVGVMKAQDVLYLNAHKPFTNKRMVVQLMPNGEAIILSLSASPDATNATPIEVVMAEHAAYASAPENEAKPLEASQTDASLSNQINPVSLTRFAIQSLYSPARLLVNPPGVSRTPMRTHRHITLVYGASMSANPLISWRGDDVYVTAVELKNQLNKPIVVSPHMLLGDWQTATFYPTNTVGARGSHDTTTVFVTSSKPFGEALLDQREFVR